MISKNRKKILLMLLPFWDPQIPPLGISCLKSFIQPEGYDIKTIDANTNEKFREIYRGYFTTIKKYIPGNKQSNLYNIGPDMLHKHIMAHLNLNAGNKNRYKELIKQLAFHTFYCDFDNGLADELKKIIRDFIRAFQTYFLDILAVEKPGVLGLSVYSGTLPASLLAFKLAKEKYPDILTVMGGGIFSSELSKGSANFEHFLRQAPYIDKIIIGEGEGLFLKLLQGELPAKQGVFTLKDIDNQYIGPTALTTPDFSDYDLNFYAQMASSTSRSCPFQCNFCVETVYWGKYRKKSAQQIASEMKTLYQRHGRQLFLMCDSLLNPVISDLANECLKSDIALYWGGYLRVNTGVCDKNNTALWRRGGFYRARLGIESGSQRILEAMKKKITISQVKEAVSSLAGAGIKTTAMFVIGYPGETEEDFRETLKLIEDLKDDIYEADCNPFWYLEDGQVNRLQWSKKKVPLYPPETHDMLMLQTHVLNCEPSRQERYQRVNRFVRHCDQLGIPNPYTLAEVYNADDRWEKLHKNAVPPLIRFQMKDRYIDECRNAKNLVKANNTRLLDKSWNF